MIDKVIPNEDDFNRLKEEMKRTTKKEWIVIGVQCVMVAVFWMGLFYGLNWYNYNYRECRLSVDGVDTVGMFKEVVPQYKSVVNEVKYMYNPNNYKNVTLNCYYVSPLK